MSSHNDVFTGEGNLPGKLYFEVDITVPPVKLPLRNVPIATKQALKTELERLENIDHIQQVEQPTDWVSSLVVTHKSNGKLRVCIDPKPLNKALKRSHYPLPVVKDTLPDLANAKMFSIGKNTQFTSGNRGLPTQSQRMHLLAADE